MVRAQFLNNLVAFLVYLSTLAPILDIDNPTRFSNFEPKRIRRSYDFIIVGGGTTGCVVAARLSENPYFNVLLIEAGSDGTKLASVPFGVGAVLKTAYDWQYIPEPQPELCCRGYKPRAFTWSRGKMLGGSSTINGMIYIRGNSRDYDTWERLGNRGWSYRDVLPYFKKIEHSSDLPFVIDDVYHSTGGPVTVTRPVFRTALTNTWLEAGDELGYPVVDVNGAQQTGFALLQTTVRDGERWDAVKAYLNPVKNRPNLHVILNTRVTKIITDSNKRAIGVYVHRDNGRGVIWCNKEIIMSAGTIETPHILKLSGIGPFRELYQFGIPLVEDLPVGENMQSHVGVGGLTFSFRDPVALNLLRYLTPKALVDYIFKKKGVLTSISGFEGAAFVNTKFSKDLGWPDVELNMLSVSIASDGGLFFRHISGVKEEVWKQYKPISFKDSCTIIPYILRPKSRGKVLLRSRNPFIKPKIITNYLKHPDDVRKLVEGIKLSISIGETSAFRRFGSKFHPVLMPGCEHTIPWSDAYLECFARTYTMQLYHDSSTCPMGLPNDPASVVDTYLRVYGVSGLRIADASVMPRIVSGNLQAACYMIGEKVSDFIKQDWSYRRRGKTSNAWPQKSNQTNC